MQFIIDNEIVGIMMDALPGNEKVIDYMNKYGQKINSITTDVLLEYMDESLELSREEMIVEINKFKENGESRPAFITDEVLNEVGKRINEFNSRIYSYYDSIFTEEQKQKANEYIQMRVAELEEINKKMGDAFLEELDAIEAEYKETGTIKTYEKKEALGTPQQQEPQTMVQTQSPISDPVLN